MDNLKSILKNEHYIVCDKQTCDNSLLNGNQIDKCWYEEVDT